ncbi:FeoA family protein [Dethiobacter alkaliphilus]|uniref:FeoA family protein n=1 Tax=Dethiobacter alkaliphilus AHT 1 TaxID=555088 RepID=C0GJ04_DETAL|nr:FeoA family protein [Dethiobacter alkaliphilus]EEG76637.1 FeoA family protein [Dethiobacter alkaliphilus AHT 1]
MASRISLDKCRVGDTGKITELGTKDRTILGKLMSLGIVPGVRVRLLRRGPGFLVQAGHTKVALDQRFAAHIIMEINRR